MTRILFFHQGEFSSINRSVLSSLQGQFPKAQLRSVDTDHLVKERPWTIARNLLSACRHYGWDMICRRRDLDDSFFSTAYIFHRVRDLISQIHREWPADLSFQTQSTFDCSCPGTPHFVYTDHTYESCKEYPVYGKAIWAPARREFLVDLEKTIYDNAVCTFTMSHNVARTLIGAYGLSPDRVVCVGAGANASAQHLTAIPLSNERYRSKTILFVGRTWERKGGAELLEAFRQVRQVHGDAALRIVGCSPRIREENVEVMGYTPLADTLQHYALASVFCMPSKLEMFGIVYLEAMAAGLPVVALRLGAAQDFVIDGETGFLTEPGDVDGLGRVLVDLLGDPDACCRMGEQARALVQEKYTWPKACAAMADRMRGALETS